MKLSLIDRSNKRVLEEVLTYYHWHKRNSALELGISRTTLYNWIDKYQIKKPKHHRNGKRK